MSLKIIFTIMCKIMCTFLCKINIIVSLPSCDITSLSLKPCATNHLSLYLVVTLPSCDYSLETFVTILLRLCSCDFTYSPLHRPTTGE